MPFDNDAIQVALDGDFYVPNDIGEAEIDDDRNHVYCSYNDQGAPTSNMLRRIYHDVENQHASLDNSAKNTIAAIRSVAYKFKLFKPEDDCKEHNCKYNEAKPCQPDEIPDNMPSWADASRFRAIKAHGTNIICLLAYIFRWKGHHYKDEYQEDIVNKWRKARNTPDRLIDDSHWKYIFTFGLHAIFPDVLDAFWINAVTDGTCANAFAIRLNVPCSGTASYFAILAGVDEFSQLYPAKAAEMERSIASLRAYTASLLLPQNRWKGGVNRKLYGAEAHTIREGEFAALASAVFGTNNAEDNQTNLGKSNSLSRVASQAPLIRNLYRAMATGMYRALESAEVQREVGQLTISRVLKVGEAEG